jgi:hypothetical protein
MRGSGGEEKVGGEHRGDGREGRTTGIGGERWCRGKGMRCYGGRDGVQVMIREGGDGAWSRVRRVLLTWHSTMTFFWRFK